MSAMSMFVICASVVLVVPTSFHEFRISISLKMIYDHDLVSEYTPHIFVNILLYLFM